MLNSPCEMFNSVVVFPMHQLQNLLSVISPSVDILFVHTSFSWLLLVVYTHFFFKKLLDILRSVFPYFFVTSLENWWAKQPPLPVFADWSEKCSLALGRSLGIGPGWRPYVFLGLWRARVLSGTVYTQLSASVSWSSQMCLSPSQGLCACVRQVSGRLAGYSSCLLSSSAGPRAKLCCCPTPQLWDGRENSQSLRQPTAGLERGTEVLFLWFSGRELCHPTVQGVSGRRTGQGQVHPPWNFLFGCDFFLEHEFCWLA